MSDLSTTAKGRIGETLVGLEMEKRGWFVYRPFFEEKVDLIGLKEREGNLEYVAIQVKTSFLTKDHSIRISRSRHMEDLTFYYIFCLIETLEKQPVFIVVPSVELKEVMKTEFQTPSWKREGYTFHITSGEKLGKWEKYKNRFMHTKLRKVG